MWCRCSKFSQIFLDGHCFVGHFNPEPQHIIHSRKAEANVYNIIYLAYGVITTNVAELVIREVVLGRLCLIGGSSNSLPYNKQTLGAFSA